MAASKCTTCMKAAVLLYISLLSWSIPLCGTIAWTNNRFSTDATTILEKKKILKVVARKVVLLCILWNSHFVIVTCYHF